MKKTAFILTIILLSSFGGLNNKSETGFSKTCLELVNSFSKHDHGNLVYNKTEKKYIQSKDFADVLRNVSGYDLKKLKTYQVETKQGKKTRRIIWSNKESDNVLRLEKKTFIATGDKCNGITITDFYINRKDKPTYIHLRLIENEFEELTLDQTHYHSFFESRLVGADEAIMELRETEK